MCKVGDIILVKNYKDNGKSISRHSFVVISDESGQIGGLDYDIICNVMSSFKDDDQKKRKMSYPGNFPISHDDSIVQNNDNKDGYIKAEQFYYFNKQKIDFIVIGRMKEDIFNLLIEFIEGLDSFSHVVDNL